jgi:creatinine amidohydrolase
MRIADMNWMQVGDQLARDDRCVLPIGSVEQHGYLSLATDAMLAERVACEAAAPLQVPVFPVLNYGFTPYFTGYPGTVSLGLATYLALVRDVITGIHRQGFRRIVVVNGHGGNAPAAGVLNELMQEQPDLQLKFHNWWNAPRTRAFAARVPRLPARHDSSPPPRLSPPRAGSPDRGGERDRAHRRRHGRPVLRQPRRVLDPYPR